MRPGRAPEGSLARTTGPCRPTFRLALARLSATDGRPDLAPQSRRACCSSRRRCLHHSASPVYLLLPNDRRESAQRAEPRLDRGHQLLPRLDADRLGRRAGDGRALGPERPVTQWKLRLMPTSLVATQTECIRASLRMVRRPARSQRDPMGVRCGQDVPSSQRPGSAPAGRASTF